MHGFRDCTGLALVSTLSQEVSEVNVNSEWVRLTCLLRLTGIDCSCPCGQWHFPKVGWQALSTAETERPQVPHCLPAIPQASFPSTLAVYLLVSELLSLSPCRPVLSLKPDPQPLSLTLTVPLPTLGFGCFSHKITHLSLILNSL